MKSVWSTGSFQAAEDRDDSENTLTRTMSSEATKVFDLSSLDKDQKGNKKVPLVQFSNGPQQGRVIVLNQGVPLILGRHKQCDVPVEEESVSRKHAQLIVGPTGQAVLRDLGSTNGTRVNDAKIVAETIVNDGDRIQLGDHISLRYLFLPETDAKVQMDIFKKATRDALTNALNRASFGEALDREMAFQTRHGDRGLGLIMFDVDFFKKINDSFGHLAGDEVLIEIGKRVGHLIRREDYFARLGGEEFALLTRHESIEGLKKLAERVRESMESTPALFEGRAISFAVSVGVTMLDGNSSKVPADQFMKTADEALYEAKNSGRNRCVFKALQIMPS